MVGAHSCVPDQLGSVPTGSEYFNRVSHPSTEISGCLPRSSRFFSFPSNHVKSIVWFRNFHVKIKCLYYELWLYLYWLANINTHRSGLRSSKFVCLQIVSFGSTLLFIGDGFCSGALIPWGLSTIIFWVLKQSLPGSGKGGTMTMARLWLTAVLLVVARWATDLNITFTSCVLCTTLTVDK